MKSSYLMQIIETLAGAAALSIAFRNLEVWTAVALTGVIVVLFVSSKLQVHFTEQEKR